MDVDVEQFLVEEYLGTNPSFLVNKLLRAFATVYNQDPTVRTIFDDSIEVAIENEKGLNEEGLK